MCCLEEVYTYLQYLLSNDPTTPNLPCLVNSTQLAHYLLVNGQGTMPTKPKCPALPTVEGNPSLVSAFSEEEYRKGIAALKNNKAVGIDDIMVDQLKIPTTTACTWWNRPEEDNSSGKLESTHPSRTSVKSDQGFFGVESVMRVNADSLLIRAAATSTSGTLNDLTTDLIMANNNNNNQLKNLGPKAHKWLHTMLNTCLIENKIPKIWR